MKYIIGIILGALLILNWSSVKTYVEEKINATAAVQEEQSSKTESDNNRQTEQEDDEDDQGASQKKSGSSNADSFSEFK